MNGQPHIMPATMLEMARQIIDGKRPQAPFLALLGIKLTTVEPGRAQMEVTVDAGHANPMGTLHGGVPCALADAAMGFAYASTLAKGESFTTLELKINFLRPVWAGLLVGEGIVVQRGRTIGLAECSVTDEKGRLIARASSTCMTLRDEQTKGR
jgi:uncharacterized protein (TIGR00369 family)